MNDKWTIARALDEIARYIELSEPNPFKARAFEKAARAVEAFAGDIEQLVSAGRVESLEGVGKATGQVIAELVTTGQSKTLDELRAQFPSGIFDLLRVPALGIKKIAILHSTLGIGDLDQLEAAARDGRIAKLKGFGARTEQKILEGIATARSRTDLFLLPVGLEIGEAIRELLASVGGIVDAEVTGAVRRRLEVLDTVDIAISSHDPALAMKEVHARSLLDGIVELDGMTLEGRARDEVRVVLHFSLPADFGTTIFVTTGSEVFVQALAGAMAKTGFELRHRTLFHNGRHVSATSERDLFKQVAIGYVDPELRENADVLARKKRVTLIEPGDLRGTFHIHTTFSDGRNSVLEMLTAARERGFDYAGISDHSQNAFYARGLTAEDLKRQKAEVERSAAEVRPLHVFRGTEADILNDGAIDYGPEMLPQFDFVVASVHSRFGMEKDEMTERLLRALDDPFVTFLGHLTGRLLLARKGYTFDFDRVFDRAAERGVMIEINGNPNRAELDWRLIGRAVDRGVTLSIHPDAHSTREFSHVISGTWIARKGGLSAAQIFNTRPVEEVSDYLAARRKRAVNAVSGRS